MKPNLLANFIALALFSMLNLHLTTSFAQGTAFTYQGRLNDNGTPASGTYDLQFTLFATNTSGVAIAGPVTNSAAAVQDGLLTVMIDFGSSILPGGSNWLEISVRTNEDLKHELGDFRQLVNSINHKLNGGDK